MKHFTSFFDFSPDTLSSLASRAVEIKSGKKPSTIAGKSLAMVFMNPSLRTRVSFETAMVRFGGHAVTLSPGNDVWSLEWREGAVMNGGRPEHVKDAVKVLGRFCDAIAIRTFGEMRDYDADMRDEMLAAFRHHSPVPVISMESASEHPCQALADMVTMRENLTEPKGRSFVLTWAPHIKPLPLAVPHSALFAGAASGMNVTIACPPGYEPHSRFLAQATEWCTAEGTGLRISHDQEAACANADIIYAKSWGAPSLYGRPDKQLQELGLYESWCVSRKQLGNSAKLLHCLPVRRNVEVTDEALDSAQSLIYEQAENRLWAQSAILEWIFQGE